MSSAAVFVWRFKGQSIFRYLFSLCSLYYVIACTFAAVVPDAHNSTYRYAMYKDKRHASDSSTKLYPYATAHKGSSLLLPCDLPGV